jgi:Zn-dependent alcohol dehydrogenase
VIKTVAEKAGVEPIDLESSSRRTQGSGACRPKAEMPELIALYTAGSKASLRF